MREASETDWTDIARYRTPHEDELVILTRRRTTTASDATHARPMSVREHLRLVADLDADLRDSTCAEHNVAAMIFANRRAATHWRSSSSSTPRESVGISLVTSPSSPTLGSYVAPNPIPAVLQARGLGGQCRDRSPSPP